VSSMLGLNFGCKGKESPKAFDHVMQIAAEIAKVDSSGLFRLTKALLGPLQAEHLLAVAERGPHNAPPVIDGYSFFFDIGNVIEVSRCWVQPTPYMEVRLASDVILPTTWRRSSYVSALATIGEGRPQGAWAQDSNHGVSVWLPWRIAFVTGGNHSITAGILGGEGIVTATEVIDVSSIFDLVECDGKEYKRKETGEIVAEVSDYRRAAVFEIGRLILSSLCRDSPQNR
jgi:hypothetical protein